jgi:two-component system response regulator ChvI
VQIIIIGYEKSTSMLNKVKVSNCETIHNLVAQELEEDKEIAPFSISSRYCYCFVDLKDLIENSHMIKHPDKIKRYYSIFINTMAGIARNFDAKIIKNTGTCLIYYFPKTSEISWSNQSTFKDVIECGLAMLAAKEAMHSEFSVERLPSLHYKIVADYGRVDVLDPFSPSMKSYARMDSMASPDSMVIGSDLYYIVKRFDYSSSSFPDSTHYGFRRIGEYPVSDNFNYLYTIYSVTGNVKDNPLDSHNHIQTLDRVHITR